MASSLKPWMTHVEVLESERDVESIRRALLGLLELGCPKEDSECQRASAVAVPTAVYDRAFMAVLAKIDATWLVETALLLRLEDLMRLGDPLEVLIALLDSLKTSHHATSRRDILLQLISTFIGDCLEPCLLDKASSEAVNNEDSEEFIQILASLPDRVASFLKDDDVTSILLRTNYFQHIPRVLYTCLCSVHAKISSSQNASLTFFASLIGKIIICGRGDFLTPFFVKLAKNGKEDFIWRRMTQQLFKKIPSGAKEVFLVNLLSVFEDGFLLTNFLGYALDDPQVEMILTKRLFFNRIIPSPTDVTLYRNLFSFLCALDDQAAKFKLVVESLLDSWATVYGKKFMAFEYEMSLTKAILIAVGILRTCVKIDLSFGQKLLKFTLRGVEKRLSSTDNKVRLNGMLVGEAITQMIQPSPDNYLKFDYVEDDEVKSLKRLLDCRPSKSTEGAAVRHPEWDRIPDRTESVFEDISTFSTKKTETIPEEIDSDDDLTPYSLPEGTLKNKSAINQPKYLQDCYEGLCKREDVSRRIVCLKSMPGLISRQPDLVEHMAVDLLKVLLGMELEGSLREARTDRHESLVAIAVSSPKTAGAFLGKEAIGRGYGIGIRLEILHVLRSAVERLAYDRASVPELPSALLDVSVPSVEQGDKELTQKVPLGKTRRFASATKSVRAVKNRLTNVSQFYILPLLGYENCLKSSFALLQKEEALLLSHLINTLGLMVFHSRSLLEGEKMALRVLEFIWEFRLHKDPAVKQAVLYSVSMVVRTIPLDFPLRDSSRLVEEVRLFLADVALTESDTKSVAMAAQVEKLLNYSLQKTLLPVRSQTDTFQTDTFQTDTFQTGSQTEVRQRGVTLEMIREISNHSANIFLNK